MRLPREAQGERVMLKMKRGGKRKREKEKERVGEGYGNG
jgi:hypothetical protein